MLGGPHLIDEETKVLRGWLSWQRSQNWNLKPSILTPESLFFTKMLDCIFLSGTSLCFFILVA